MEEKIIKEAIVNLKNLSYSLDNIYMDKIQLLENMCSDQTFRVAVIGEFSMGKSTFLNALIGKRILYSSSDEATGTVTEIKNNPNSKATISFKNDKKEYKDIGNIEQYNQLAKFLDIKYEGTEIDSIGIEYPFKGIDKDVRFIDTPGLQGISMEQLKITKKAVQNANATIILISQKGLTQTELDLLCGNNKDFGVINTKKIFIVINRIGEIYNGNSKEYAVGKINQLIEDVKNQLESNGVENAKVFAVDSLDYLWAQDDELYKEVVSKTDKDVNKILDQKEYLERSRYPEFKTYLFEFLEEGNRQKAFLEDITEKLNFIINDFKALKEKDYKESDKSSGDIINRLIVQKNTILDNRKKFVNTLKRQLNSLSGEFSESMKSDIAEIMKNNKREIGISIRDNLKENDSSESLKEKTKSFQNELNGKIHLEVKELVDTLNNYYDAIGVILKDTFNKEFKKIFKFNMSYEVDFKIDLENININFEFKNSDFKSGYDEQILELQSEYIEIADGINNYDKRDINYKINYWKRCIEEREREIKQLTADYKEKVKKLGERPQPIQKYKYEKVKRKKWIFFDDSYFEERPDGLDDTLCKKWDENNKEIYDNYLRNKKLIEGKKDILVKDKDKLEKELKLLIENEERLIEINIEIQALTKSSKILFEKNKKDYLENKKQEVFQWLFKNYQKNWTAIENKILDEIDKRKKEIEKIIEKETNIHLDFYNKEIDKDMEKIKNKISNMKVDEIKIFNNLEDIQKQININ